MGTAANGDETREVRASEWMCYDAREFGLDSGGSGVPKKSFTEK